MNLLALQISKDISLIKPSIYKATGNRFGKVTIWGTGEMIQHARAFATLEGNQAQFSAQNHP